ncbi:metalloregulator ArsR/SmtB family transcription factor [Polynucleobacter sp. JS-JIR-II-c23]|uniref:ArsR/SmtB family transcription factor n=2 Tax=Burkholderiaceae TaxID=119060 RepID=UPI001BFCE80F|nr:MULTISPECIES: metalloregulator ArsR/SmtB family transcription factor [unclassified Polynucleobacter]MEA9604582.1 metalloregulator ArsR/SmtB family transcription factor [Polynucleobacter sp. JS-JIR-II-c23]QWE02901.1 winged helix-turn-helix transcriptional regulator [Polynucleobacter sp. JS-JIR-II-b4]
MLSEKKRIAELKKMQSSATKACEFLKVLSNPSRLMLLCEIAVEERCVGDLEESTGIHQPTLSQQLTVLRTKKLVKTRRDGKQIYYSLSSDITLSVMNLLYSHYCKK